MRGRNSGCGTGSLEALEQRRLLAGTVTVTLDPTTQQLNIVGDNKSNQVVIGLDVNNLAVQGTNGTTIKGPTSVAFPPGGINVDMGNGDDSVSFDPAISGGTISAGLPLTVNTGNGDDTVLIRHFVFIQMNISTGNGNDHVELDLGGAGFTSGTTNIDTGNGDDSIAIDGLLQGSVTLNGGHGSDALSGIAFINTGTPTIIDVETIS